MGGWGDGLGGERCGRGIERVGGKDWRDAQTGMTCTRAKHESMVMSKEN